MTADIEVTGLTFSTALVFLKEGKRVSREGWNGKNMWLTLVPGSTITISADRPLGQALPERVGQTLKYLPHIDMYTATGDLVPWLASQTDILADDWCLLR